MKTRILVLAVGLLGVLAGCATNPETAKAVAEAQARIASQPTVMIECAQGCKASYTDPRDRAVGVRMPTNGWDAVAGVAGSVERIVTGAVLPAAAVAAMREVRRAGEGGNTSTTTTTTHTASGAGASTGGAASYEQVGPDSQNTTSGDTATTTSTTTDSHDATATPTVVTQPAPVVIRPEVVTPIIWTPIP